MTSAATCCECGGNSDSASESESSVGAVVKQHGDSGPGASSDDASDAWCTMNCGARWSSRRSRMLQASMLSLMAAAGLELTSFQSAAEAV